MRSCQILLICGILSSYVSCEVIVADKVDSKLDTKSIDLKLKNDPQEDLPGTKAKITELKPSDIPEEAVEKAPDYMREGEDEPPATASTDTLSQLTSGSETETPSSDFHSFVMAVSMIAVSEIGDKTFLIAALMAMRSPRLVVFSAAASALIIMTVLSGVVGHALPALIPQQFTQFLASLLFIVFGYRLFKEGMEMSHEIGVSDEMAEVEEEIALSSINAKNDDIEAGPEVKKQTGWKQFLQDFKLLAGLVLSPTWVQVFVLTFLGEWGDRSQIATIAMAAGSDYWFVILGGCVGHTACTAVAVVGGMLLASKISMRQVTLGGAVTFFIFAILYLYEAIYGEH